MDADKCPGGINGCPCICHDTGGADYGMHGEGKCKGAVTDDWAVVT